MEELSVIWLRVAAAFYSLGLLHAILTVVRRREHLFRVALVGFGIAGILHTVSLVDEFILTGQFPANNFFESLSFCALLITALFLFVYWRYKVESLSVFIFPLVFVMTLVATMANPVSTWSSPMVRSAWLLVHVILVMLGYAALLFTAVASVLYLFQERELKNKKPRKFYYRLPALGTLDDLISKSMAFGFVFITLAVIAGSTWAFVELKSGWIREPKIAISFFTWGVYMAMVFFRITAGWRGRKAAILAIVVLGCSAVTWAAHAGLRSMLIRQ
jgi:ABC-type transport system involved in cytochrome c biogenesis permease subunit